VDKILAVVRREFTERVRQRWFWVIVLLGPLFFGGIFILPTLLASGGGVKRIVVVDGTTSHLGQRVAEQLTQSKVFVATSIPAGGRGADTLTLTDDVSAKRLDGFLLLTDALVDSGKAEYRASNVSAFKAIGTLEGTLRGLALSVRLERAGVDPQIVARSQVRVDLDSKKIAGGKTTSESAAQSFSLAYFMGIILYMAILLYGINVMSSVLEEKTTRIVEVLLSSLRPFQLLLGKVLGVGAVSIFQFLLWGLSARVLIAQRSHLLGSRATDDAGQVFQVPHVTATTAIVFGAYFIGGFFLYSAMFAAVGAMSSNEQEARQAQQPVTMLLVASFISMFAMLNDPGSTLSVTLSMVPFSSPIAMPVRWAAGNLPLSEVALSLAILFVSIIVVTWIASRIYRVGILMTGKRPNLKELVRWVRAA
jgi:ABC-2 type transport system permease protein